MDRKQAEREFHDQREFDRHVLSEEEWLAKYSNKKWYAIDRQKNAFVDKWLKENCPGAVALDFGCGLGAMSEKLARFGATVYAIDISPESVKATQDRLTGAGMGDRLHAAVMDAENLTFEDDKFDIIICSGVLHHMDVNLAFPELARVLKPTGTVVAIEALGYNPIITAYRKMTPKLRTAWETDHILTFKELNVARRHFKNLKVNFFYLLSILAVPLRKTFIFGPMLSLFRAIDNVILSIPGLRLMAWQMVFFLKEPIKSRA